MKCMSEHTGLISSYQLLITAACTNTGGKMKDSHSRAADWCPFVPRHSLNQVTSFMQLGMLWCLLFVLWLSDQFWRFYSMPFVHHRGAYSVLLTHDNLCNPTPVKQVGVTAIVILTNICRASTMHLCMDSIKFLLEAPGASILWGCYYFVTTCKPIWGCFF